jgi:hypothetical protein
MYCDDIKDMTPVFSSFYSSFFPPISFVMCAWNSCSVIIRWFFIVSRVPFFVMHDGIADVVACLSAAWAFLLWGALCFHLFLVVYFFLAGISNQLETKEWGRLRNTSTASSTYKE